MGGAQVRSQLRSWQDLTRRCLLGEHAERIQMIPKVSRGQRSRGLFARLAVDRNFRPFWNIGADVEFLAAERESPSLWGLP